MAARARAARRRVPTVRRNVRLHPDVMKQLEYWAKQWRVPFAQVLTVAAAQWAHLMRDLHGLVWLGDPELPAHRVVGRSVGRPAGLDELDERKEKRRGL